MFNCRDIAKICYFYPNVFLTNQGNLFLLEHKIAWIEFFQELTKASRKL
jgi:hypothetical protein